MPNNLSLGLHKDKVSLVDYCPDWTQAFEQEKKNLQKILGNAALAIEHVGSTSIPGLSAKPILDVAVAVKNVKTLVKVMPILANAGYDILDSIEKCGEVLARKGPPECRTHYIHVEVMDSIYWKNHIVFRDYLLKHPAYIEQYETLKKNIAKQFKEDRKKYTAAKDEFIRSVLKAAEIDNQTSLTL